MTSATATGPYPFAPTTSAIAASRRPRWDSHTTSRGAAWRPRGRADVRIAPTVYASGNNRVSTKREREPMTATAEPLTDPATPATAPRHVRVGIVGAGFAGLGM